MKLSHEDEASFFKILLNNLADYIPLPTAFAKKYLDSGNNKKQTVVLKNKSSDVLQWSVKYYKIEARYYFMDGWLNFMKDNHLQIGDFLVFSRLSHSPNLMFQVFFYAPNGSLKLPLHRRPPSSVIGGESLFKPGVKEESSDKDPDENMERTLKRVVWKSHNHKMPLTKSFAKSAGISGYDHVRLKTDEGKIREVKLSKYGMTLFMTSGWVDFKKDNKINIGDTCVFNHVKDDLLHVHVFKKKKRGRVPKTV